MSATAVNSTAAEIIASWSPARSTAAAAISIRRMQLLGEHDRGKLRADPVAVALRCRRLLASRALNRSISSRSASWLDGAPSGFGVTLQVRQHRNGFRYRGARSVGVGPRCRVRIGGFLRLGLSGRRQSRCGSRFR